MSEQTIKELCLKLNIPYISRGRKSLLILLSMFCMVGVSVYITLYDAKSLLIILIGSMSIYLSIFKEHPDRYEHLPKVFRVITKVIYYFIIGTIIEDSSEEKVKYELKKMLTIHTNGYTINLYEDNKSLIKIGNLLLNNSEYIRLVSKQDSVLESDLFKNSSESVKQDILSDLESELALFKLHAFNDIQKIFTPNVDDLVELEQGDEYYQHVQMSYTELPSVGHLNELIPVLSELEKGDS